jgi:hypothetical protein
MKLLSVAGVFMLGGILFPIVLVLLAILVDSTIAAAVAVWWGWSRLHGSYAHYVARHSPSH